MRVRDHPFFFERRHFIPHRRARKPQLVALHKRLRPDGLRRADEVIDDEGEDARTAL
jgi:hypothetical protein